MNKDQGGGVIERVIYGAILYVVMKYGASWGLSADDAAWIAGGGVALAGGAYGWYHNRPASVLNRAANAIPDKAQLVITTAPSASAADRIDAHDLASTANDKVIAKTA